MMNIKLSICLFMLFGGLSTAIAQDVPEFNIDFKHCSFEEAIKMAKVEGKSIFVDCYTVWCGPCKALARDVFTQKSVADYHNANFINLKMDMEKGEGVDLAKKWKVSAFPTLVYLNSNGDEIHRKVGGGPPEAIINAAKIALSGKGIGFLTMRFEKGERNDEFILEYLMELRKAYKQNEIETVVSTVLNERSKESWTMANNWKIFDKYCGNVYSTIAEYFLSNRALYAKSVGAEVVDKKVMNLYQREVFNVIKYDKSTHSYSIIKPSYEKYINSLTSYKIERKAYFVSNIEFMLAGSDMQKCITIAEAYIANDKSFIGTQQLYEWALKIRRLYYDEVVVKKSDEWLNMVIANTHSEELKTKCRNIIDGIVQNPYGMLMKQAVKFTKLSK